MTYHLNTHYDMETRVDRRALAVLGLKIKDISFTGIDRLIRRGIPYSSFECAMKALELTEQELLYILDISRQKMNSIQKLSNRLPLVASDRLYSITRILAFTIEVLGNEETARRWLKHPLIDFGGRVPIDIMLTEPGRIELENVLGRMEHSIPP